MYDPRAVANSMIACAATEGLKLSNLKLQKLLYLAHGWFLVCENRPLVKGGFEAWAHGPVSRTAYHAFKDYDERPITAPATKYDPIRARTTEIVVNIDDEALFAIEETVRIFGRWSAFDLVELTHQPGTPWSVTQDQARYSANVGMVIDDALIADRFEGVINRDLDNEAQV